jgi:hypothetical protein
MAHNVRWCLMIFDAAGKRLLAPIMLTDDQVAGLRPYFGDADIDEHFGRYPVISVRIFAEEHVDE